MLMELLHIMDALINLCFTTNYCMIEPWNWAPLVPWKKNTKKYYQFTTNAKGGKVSSMFLDNTEPLSTVICYIAASKLIRGIFFGIQILNKSWPVVLFSTGFRSKPMDFTAPALALFTSNQPVRPSEVLWRESLVGDFTFSASTYPSVQVQSKLRSVRKAKRAPIRHTSPENRNAAQSWSVFCGKCSLSEMSNALYTASVTA